MSYTSWSLSKHIEVPPGHEIPAAEGWYEPVDGRQMILLNEILSVIKTITDTAADQKS